MSGPNATVRNPIEWSADQVRGFAGAVGSTASRGLMDVVRERDLGDVPVARIGVADLKVALRRGYADFGDSRVDVILLCLFYPAVGLLLARATSGQDLMPLLFPLAAGFTLIGPVAAIGLYEMNRRREAGAEVGWADAFGVLRSRSLGPLLALGVLLAVLYGAWITAAGLIYDLTVGPLHPASATEFARDVVTTAPGLTMIVVGMAVGLGFAIVALAIGVVSFPMLVDRDVGVQTALRTSVRAVTVNPGTMALWGLIVAGGLVLGSIPLFLGLVVVFPLLGHATWHLYRRVVPGLRA